MAREIPDAETVGEISGGAVGEELRRLLTEDRYLELDTRALTVASMVVADHFYQVEDEIAPLLAEGTVVLKERYFETMHACQPPQIEEAYGRERDARRFLDGVERLTPATPDLTIYLSVPREELYRRLRERGEEVTEQTERVLETRERIYRRRVEEYGDRIVVYENDVPLERAVEDVTDVVRSRIE